MERDPQKFSEIKIAQGGGPDEHLSGRHKFYQKGGYVYSVMRLIHPIFYFLIGIFFAGVLALGGGIFWGGKTAEDTGQNQNQVSAVSTRETEPHIRSNDTQESNESTRPPGNEGSDQAEDEMNPSENAKPVLQPAALIEEMVGEGSKLHFAQDLSDVPNGSEVQRFLSEWVAAWEASAGPNGNITPYSEFYSAQFKHKGYDKNMWIESKGGTNNRKAWITVSLEDIKVTPVNESNLEVQFLQIYSSSNYSEKSPKKLTITREAGGWKILREASIE